MPVELQTGAVSRRSFLSLLAATRTGLLVSNLGDCATTAPFANARCAFLGYCLMRPNPHDPGCIYVVELPTEG
jgi:hypothetical protein